VSFFLGHYLSLEKETNTSDYLLPSPNDFNMFNPSKSTRSSSPTKQGWSTRSTFKHNEKATTVEEVDVAS